MLPNVFKIILCVVMALILGIGSALWAVRNTSRAAWLQNGAWRVNLAIGSEELGMYSRAAVAFAGLFAMQKSEAIYFVASTDDDGRPLQSRCDYRIEGTDLDSRWWSITLYGSDFFLIPNNQNRYSYNGGNLIREPDGSYRIWISNSARQGNWIPSGTEDQLHLALRLYNPMPSVYEQTDRIDLPRIIRDTCR
ncbi:MAG: DUF1214 domain-containing protein [Deltaproteobacteria bacterium]|jgi:hypothetical protein|nr:DUF1214 domain-containing protein [Deltaproteobacteria bacterium]